MQVLITGSGSGLGRAMAEAFAKEGYLVVVTDQNLAAASRVASDLNEIGYKAVYYRLDVQSESDWLDVCNNCEALGGLDVLVNNAGIIERQSIEEFDVISFRKTIDVNLVGAMTGIREATRKKINKNLRSIINISSTSGFIGYDGGYAAYSASKAALIAITKCAAIELSSRKIRVNAICPSALLSDLTNSVLLKTEMEERVNAAPLGRLAEFDDVCGAVLFLASEKSSYVTGVEIIIDGGITSTMRRLV